MIAFVTLMLHMCVHGFRGDVGDLLVFGVALNEILSLRILFDSSEELNGINP
jgi:hypothetical protein